MKIDLLPVVHPTYLNDECDFLSRVYSFLDSLDTRFWSRLMGVSGLGGRNFMDTILNM